MRLANVVIVLFALVGFSPSLGLTPRHSPRPPCRDLPNTQQYQQQERNEITRTTTSRRSFFDGAAIAGTALFTTTLVLPVLSAHAKYGASSTMALPN